MSGFDFLTDRTYPVSVAVDYATELISQGGTQLCGLSECLSPPLAGDGLVDVIGTFEQSWSAAILELVEATSWLSTVVGDTATFYLTADDAAAYSVGAVQHV